MLMGDSPGTDLREARMPKLYSQDLRERVVRAVEAVLYEGKRFVGSEVVMRARIGGRWRRL
jgi:hypothetical protein